MDNHQYIKELFKVVSIDSILVINREGQLKRIYCPFPIEVIIPVGKYKLGMVIFAEAVKMTPDLKDVFIIEGKAYYPFYFKIL